MCVPNSPLFQHCQVYDWPPFFQQKVYGWPSFSGFLMWKAPFFWHPGICTYFSLRDFSRLLILLVLHELTVIFVQQPAKMGTKKIRQYMNRSTFWMVKYMNGSIFSKTRYMNGVGFEILARTPVPKLPLSYPPLSLKEATRRGVRLFS